MLIKRAGDIAPSEITSEALYLRRRQFIAGGEDSDARAAMHDRVRDSKCG